MANVIAVHSVGDIDTWLTTENREVHFPKFCSGYRLFRIPGEDKVAILWQDVDMEVLQATLGGAEGTAAKAADTVIDPIELFLEIDGGR